MSPNDPNGRRPPRPPRPAAWWAASLRRPPLAWSLARPMLNLLGGWSRPVAWATIGLTVPGCAEIFANSDPDPMRASLDEQRQTGWNVGSEGAPLAFPSAQPTDIAGGGAWRQAMDELAARLAPRGAAWTPYYVPTLFQALETPRNADLRAVMRPIFTPEMGLGSRRGEALLSLLMDGGVCRTDVALVLDLPGPEAVAVAAALSPCLDPVFVVDNWPHPAGVVEAHLTLAAALYFLPAFDRAAPVRAPGAAPMFVLDRRRTAPYVDDAGQFDNRYLAALPPPEALRAAGIHQILYVTPNDQGTSPADDVNDDLVAFNGAGLDVRMLAMSDFAESPLPGWPEPPPCEPTVAGPGSGFYFGGSPGAHACFPWWYGWRLPSGGSAASSAPAWSIQIPQPLASRCHFHPSTRALLSPSSIGHRGGGGGWHGWHGWAGGRSGSLGRMHGGGFSG